MILCENNMNDPFFFYNSQFDTVLRKNDGY